MHRVTEERTHRECGWKHSAKDTESMRSTARSRHVGLTNSAFSWKFAKRKQRPSNSKDHAFGRYAAASKPCKLLALANRGGGPKHPSSAPLREGGGPC